MPQGADFSNAALLHMGVTLQGRCFPFLCVRRGVHTGISLYRREGIDVVVERSISNKFERGIAPVALC